MMFLVSLVVSDVFFRIIMLFLCGMEKKIYGTLQFLVITPLGEHSSKVVECEDREYFNKSMHTQNNNNKQNKFV